MFLEARVATVQVPPSPSERGKLGQYLWDLRQATRMSLREVELASENEVSNGYLSQLETGRIRNPSPAILRALAEVYERKMPQSFPSRATYQRMMELAGHIRPADARAQKRRSRLPTFAKEELSAEEEEELLKYLAYLRMRRGRSET
jgi:HTH-type transcriptional regulator, competence development regulator